VEPSRVDCISVSCIYGFYTTRICISNYINNVHFIEYSSMPRRARLHSQHRITKKKAEKQPEKSSWGSSAWMLYASESPYSRQDSAQQDIAMAKTGQCQWSSRPSGCMDTTNVLLHSWTLAEKHAHQDIHRPSTENSLMNTTVWFQTARGVLNFKLSWDCPSDPSNTLAVRGHIRHPGQFKKQRCSSGHW